MLTPPWQIGERAKTLLISFHAYGRGVNEFAYHIALERDTEEVTDQRTENKATSTRVSTHTTHTTHAYIIRIRSELTQTQGEIGARS